MMKRACGAEKMREFWVGKRGHVPVLAVSASSTSNGAQFEGCWLNSSHRPTSHQFKLTNFRHNLFNRFCHEHCKNEIYLLQSYLHVIDKA